MITFVSQRLVIVAKIWISAVFSEAGMCKKVKLYMASVPLSLSLV